MEELRKRKPVIRLVAFLVGLLTAAPVGAATAVEVGAPAPGFKLPSTSGSDISLGDFKGKKAVLLEFYGLDFAPV